MLAHQLRRCVIAVLPLLPLIISVCSHASSENVVHEFDSQPYGAQPNGNLVADGDGNLYGTASAGGANGNGTVFELVRQPDGNYKLTVLYTFTGGSDGRSPSSGVTFDAVGNLWGTATYGGVGAGTVFRLSRKNGRWKEETIYSFGSQNGDGYYPSGLTFDKAGRIFGTNRQGGSQYGTVFMLSKTDAGGSIWKESVLYTFSGYNDGSYPVGSLVLDDKDNLYGVTEAGGQLCQDFNYCGTAFMLKPPKHSGDAWTESVLHSFGIGGTYGDGFTPLAGLIFDANHNLYGTTFSGGLGDGSSCLDTGLNGCGVVFELTPGNGGEWDETILYEFLGDTDGNSPYAGLVLSDRGDLYGTTFGGGRDGCRNGCGTVFELSPGHGGGGWTKTIVHTFLGGMDGGTPYGGMLLDTAGNLYGGTSVGGAAGLGNAFKMTPTHPGHWKETVIAGFPSTDGSGPSANLISDAQNDLYGTTTAGGSCGRAYGISYGCGTVFELVASADGQWNKNILYDFKPLGDGAEPSGGLVFDRSGNLYGTTSRGGAYGWGSVFELSRQSDGRWLETVLYSFQNGPDGRNPLGSLVFDGAGNLYGTTTYGGYCGENGCYGTVFELSPSASGWTETVLYSFTDGNDGSVPVAGLIFDAAGNLYGTTSGYSNNGSVFELSPSSTGWVESTLYTFSGQSDGGGPLCTLVFDATGNIYGTTSYGGVSRYGGTVFELSHSGGHWTGSVLYSFTGGSDGESPAAGVIFDNSGNLYGTTQLGGADNYGTVFELSPSGSSWTESVLYSFTGSRDGKNPVASLLPGANGALYGTAEYSSENGVAFSVMP
jgi:uncharacterized repeat protein (TIGR03803 family)